MRDPRLDKLADVIVRYSTRVKPGDLVSIVSDPLAMPLIEAVYHAVLKAGGNPYWFVRAESPTEIMLSHGSEEQLKLLNPTSPLHVEKIDVPIGFWAANNTQS